MWSLEVRDPGLPSAPELGAGSWLPVGRAQPGPVPAHVGHSMSTWPGYHRAVPSRWPAGQDGAQVPACSSFPGQGNRHTRQILSARCSPQAPRLLLPRAPVNKLYNGHRGRLQNPSWLLGSARLGVVAWAPQGVPGGPVAWSPRLMLRAVAGLDSACHRGALPPAAPPAGFCGGEGSPPGEHTHVCKPPLGVNVAVRTQTHCAGSPQLCQHTHTEAVPLSPLSPARAGPAGSSCSMSSPARALAVHGSLPPACPSEPSLQ